MVKSKNRPDKSRTVFEILPREKKDPLCNDPFSSPNIIIPLQNVDKNFLLRLGITDDLLPQNMRTHSKLEVVENTEVDPAVFNALYDDGLEEVTDQLIEQANEETKTCHYSQYGFVMNRFLNDVDSADLQDSKPVHIKPLLSLGTSCATSRRSNALRAFDERFQTFIDCQSEMGTCVSENLRNELSETELFDLSDDLSRLMNEKCNTDVPVFPDTYYIPDEEESEVSTVVEEDIVSCRSSSARCMYSGKLMDGSQYDTCSMLSCSSRMSQPSVIVHKIRTPRRLREDSICEVEELEVLPAPDFSKMGRKEWKVMVKVDRQSRRIRKKETKVLFSNNKLAAQHTASRGQAKNVKIV